MSGQSQSRRYLALSEVPEPDERPASSHSFARNSWALIPIARAVVSARLSLGPRSMPMAASREASKSAGDWPGTAGAGNLRIAFSSTANRDLSLDCIYFQSAFTTPATLSQRDGLAVSAARSNSDTRASMSSISIAFEAWAKIESATRARTDAGVFGSTSSFISVVAAAEVPC